MKFEYPQEQAIHDHFEAQKPSDGCYRGSIRTNHPRERQKYKLCNISTLSFLTKLEHGNNLVAQDFITVLPVRLRDLPGKTLEGIATKKLKSLKAIGLVENGVKSVNWNLTTAGYNTLCFRRFTSPLIGHDENSELFIIKRFFQEKLEGLLPDLQREAIIAKFHTLKEVRWDSAKLLERTYWLVQEALTKIDQFEPDYLFELITTTRHDMKGFV